MAPGSAKSMTISFCRPYGVSLRCAGNMRSGGGWKPRTMTWREAPMALPERRKNGTPCQRQLSTSARTATIVSVCESAATPGSDRYPSYWPRTTCRTSIGFSAS